MPLPHQHLQGYEKVHSCIKDYQCVQADFGIRVRNISCTGSVCERAGEEGCAFSTGPCGWCCCHRFDQQRGSWTHTRTATFISQPFWEGVFLYHCRTACATVSITGNIAKYVPKRAKSTGANLQVKEMVAFLLMDCCSWQFYSVFFLLIPNFCLFRETHLDSLEWVEILPLLAQYFQLFTSLDRSFSLYYSGKCQRAVLACVQ